jgi:hypothetical protein
VRRFKQFKQLNVARSLLLDQVMDLTELDGEWFAKGEALAESGDESFEEVEEAPPESRRWRFGLVLAATGVALATLLGVASIV